MAASHQAVAEANAQVAPKVRSPGGRACNREGEGRMESRKLAETAVPLQRGGSDGMATRTRRATGEALLIPSRNGRRKVGRITREAGKSVEDERVAEGSVVARKRGNAR
jgi:hypothetical protein